MKIGTRAELWRLKEGVLTCGLKGFKLLSSRENFITRSLGCSSWKVNLAAPRAGLRERLGRATFALGHRPEKPAGWEPIRPCRRVGQCAANLLWFLEHARVEQA